MTLESLLVTRDQQVIGVLRPAMEKLSIDVEVCRGARSGNEILQAEKFDAVIVDCDDLEGGLDVLQSLRKSLSNRNSVTFAILNGNTTTQAAFEMGAKFVLQKPISQLNATRCFSAALSFMVRSGAVISATRSRSQSISSLALSHFRRLEPTLVMAAWRFILRENCPTAVYPQFPSVCREQMQSSRRKRRLPGWMARGAPASVSWNYRPIRVNCSTVG